MMLSNGGLNRLQEAKNNPIALLESGPAAGVTSAAYFGKEENFQQLLAFDMGGTTAKLCLIENGQAAITHAFEAARLKRFVPGSGIPLHITTVDLIEIGAGGGSIAELDALALLTVGPKSAGSEPGPACYGLGGVKPTVTDANLILGYLNPEYFAGGSLSIYPSRAVEALSQMGQSLDRSLIDVAWGIHDVVAENMAGAARVHVAERGRDPRDFVLVCTGGGGPLHAYYVAQKIGVSKIICPPSAGVASAFGLLMASARSDLSRTLNFKFSSNELSPLENAYRELEVEARSTLETLSYAFGPISIKRQADGRFIGQGFNLSVELPEGPYSDDTVQSENNIRIKLVQAFESAYKEKFGRTPPDVQVEFVNVRISGDAPPHTQFVPELMRIGHDVGPKGFREVYFKELNAYIETPIFERAELSTGFSAKGPLLIEDVSSTLVVGPKGRVEQLASGNLVITIGDVEQ
jgi:N-methylhydantoinase A